MDKIYTQKHFPNNKDNSIFIEKPPSSLAKTQIPGFLQINDSHNNIYVNNNRSYGSSTVRLKSCRDIDKPVRNPGLELDKN